MLTRNNIDKIYYVTGGGQALRKLQTSDSSTLAYQSVQAFMRVAGNRIATHDSDIARLTASELLRSAESADVADTSCMFPVEDTYGQFVPALAAVASQCAHLSESDELMKCLFGCVAYLQWRQAGFGQLPISIRDKILVAELVGPNGMCYHSDVRCGLLLQRAYVQYPWHSHVAEELYLVLAGNAKWAVDENMPTMREPGSFVHHRSLQPHCMITRAESLLAFWVWSGDVNGASYACH